VGWYARCGAEATPLPKGCRYTYILRQQSACQMTPNNPKIMMQEISEAIELAIVHEPADFLIATKQEDYLNYRIASYLTKKNSKSIYPTQYQRLDIAQIDSITGVIQSAFEAKYMYSSDFNTEYAEKCTRTDFDKLNGTVHANIGEKYILHFVVHFRKEHLPIWRDNIDIKNIGFRSGKHYFTYLNYKNKWRFKDSLNFINTYSNIYDQNFTDHYLAEINSLNLPLSLIGNKYYDLSKSMFQIGGKSFQIPHVFHWFLWQINKETK
jgi:hypothetical protein